MTGQVNINDIYVIMGRMINDGNEETANIISNLLSEYQRLKQIEEAYNKPVQLGEWQQLVAENERLNRMDENIKNMINTLNEQAEVRNYSLAFANNRYFAKILEGLYE